MNLPGQHLNINTHPSFLWSQWISWINWVNRFLTTAWFGVRVTTFSGSFWIIWVFWEQWIPVGTQIFETSDVDMVNVVT